MYNKKQAVDILAKTILKEASGSKINALEALASVYVNHAKYIGAIDDNKGLQNLIVDSCLHKNSKVLSNMDNQCNLFKTCQRIARRALSGNVKDITGGATKYHKASEYPEWAEALPPIACIGDLLFYK